MGLLRISIMVRRLKGNICNHRLLTRNLRLTTITIVGTIILQVDFPNLRGVVDDSHHAEVTGGAVFPRETRLDLRDLEGVDVKADFGVEDADSTPTGSETIEYN